MKERNLLAKYPSPKQKRIVSDKLRTIMHRIIASERGFEFFDGDRNYGYGGFNYDGRWKPIAKKIVDIYQLKEGSKFLQISSEKGYLLHDLKSINPEINVFGTETSSYAISQSINDIKENIVLSAPTQLPFPDNYFDFVIGLGVIYTLNITDAITAIKEITRVSKGNSFVTLASYNEPSDYFLFKQWTLLGTTILKKEEWIKILNHCDYQGDYFFTNSETLNLVRDKSKTTPNKFS